MRSRGLKKSMLPVVLAVIMTACGGSTSDVPEADPDSPTSQSPSTSSTDTSTTSVDTDPTTTSGAASTHDPCGLLTEAELEEAIGFTLISGMLIDLTAQGIEGSTCFFEADSSGNANVSVTVVTGPQAGDLFESELPEGGNSIDGAGDQAYLAVGDIQSNVFVLQGDVLVAIEIVHATGTRPDDIDERLADLAGIAAGRL